MPGAVEAYDFDDSPERIDRSVVQAFLATEAYWGRWRTPDDIDQQITVSWRVVGCYLRSSGELVGFARAVSDGIGFAYLADVFVVPAHRGKQLGERLVETMVEGGPGADFRWLLHTADAHGLYAKFGFFPPDSTVLERPHVSTRSAAGS